MKTGVTGLPPPLSCTKRGPEQAPRERGCDTPRWPPRCGLGCEAAGRAWQGPRPQAWPLLANPWLSEPGGLSNRQRVLSQTGQGWEAEQRPCGVLTGEHPAGSPCVWREPPPSHPHSTHSDPHSEHHLFRDFPGRALGPGRRDISRVPRASDSEGPKPRTPRAGATGLSMEARCAAVPTSEAPAPPFVLCCQLFKRTTAPIKTLSSLPQDARRRPTRPQRGDRACTWLAGQTRGAWLIFLEGSSSGLCPAGQGGCGSGWARLPHTWRGLPQTAGLGPAGPPGQDRLGGRARPSPPFSVIEQDAPGSPGADRALSSARLSFAEKRQPPRSPEFQGINLTREVRICRDRLGGFMGPCKGPAWLTTRGEAPPGRVGSRPALVVGTARARRPWAARVLFLPRGGLCTFLSLSKVGSKPSALGARLPPQQGLGPRDRE